MARIGAKLAFGMMLLISAVAMGGRAKLNIDPETKEGFVLQQIKQERDPAKKIALMVQFADEFAKDENLPWVLDQLIPHYTETRQWEKLLAAGEKLQAAQPGDLDAAESCLAAARELKLPNEAVYKHAKRAWQSADAQLKVAAPAEPSRASAWKASLESATRLKQMAEYAVYSFAQDSAMQKQALNWLEEMNPTSVYLISSSAQFASVYQAQGHTAKMLSAVRDALEKEPENTDYLATLSEHGMKQNDYAAVTGYSSRLISVLNGPRPAAISETDWESKKTRYLAPAYWLNAVTNMARGNLHQADKSFRAALPFFRTNRDYLSAGLYNLGYINYKLAEKGEPGRVPEALRFSKQCVDLKGPHAPQAEQNIAAIKAEYNIQ